MVADAADTPRNNWMTVEEFRELVNKPLFRWHMLLWPLAGFLLGSGVGWLCNR